MQEFCRTYAKEYNKLGPPKKVNFLQAFLVVFHERSPRGQSKLQRRVGANTQMPFSNWCLLGNHLNLK